MEKYNKERLARASEAVRKAGLSQIIVSDAAALWYLTEEEIHPGERLTVLVIPSDSDPYWVRNRLFPLKSNGIADHPFEDGEDGIGLLASLLADGRTGVDGVCHSAFLLDLMGRGGNRTFVNGSPLIDALRAVKDEEEIRRM
ncbi:aminopeptidase P family N-terminal domain-containing protein, partial [Dialister hominis]